MCGRKRCPGFYCCKLNSILFLLCSFTSERSILTLCSPFPFPIPTICPCRFQFFLLFAPFNHPPFGTLATLQCPPSKPVTHLQTAALHSLPGPPETWSTWSTMRITSWTIKSLRSLHKRMVVLRHLKRLNMHNSHSPLRRISNIFKNFG